MAFKLKAADRKIIDTLLATLETVKSELVDKLSEIHTDWEAEFEDKSDRWKETENGQAAYEKIEAIAELRDSAEEMGLEGDLDALS